jgi:hypothetical protein
MQSLAVTNDCEVPEGAWEFMKFCLDRIDAEWDYVEPTEKDGEYVDNISFFAPKGFSGVRATVEKMFETLKHYYYFATLTETSLMPGVVMLNDSYVAYHYDKDGTCRDMHAKYENQSTAVMYTLTEEDAAAFMQLLDGVTAVQSSDEALLDIIYEDAQYYFNGTKSLDETVRIIENRVGIKLAE